MKIIGMAIIMVSAGVSMSASAMQVSGASGRATDPRLVGNYGPGTHDGDARDHALPKECLKVRKADREACRKRVGEQPTHPSTGHAEPK
jgi:hypothetical protein